MTSKGKWNSFDPRSSGQTKVKDHTLIILGENLQETSEFLELYNELLPHEDQMAPDCLQSHAIYFLSRKLPMEVDVNDERRNGSRETPAIAQTIYTDSENSLASYSIEKYEGSKGQNASQEAAATAPARIEQKISTSHTDPALRETGESYNRRNKTDLGKKVDAESKHFLSSHLLYCENK